MKIATIANQGDSDAVYNAVLVAAITGECAYFKKQEKVYIMDREEELTQVRRKGDFVEYWIYSDRV